MMEIQVLAWDRHNVAGLNRLMVINATVNNISVILWWSVLLLEETRGPGENHQPYKPYHLLYTSPWKGFDLTTLEWW
jgi:hypothetical protein